MELLQWHKLLYNEDESEFGGAVIKASSKNMQEYFNLDLILKLTTLGNVLLKPLSNQPDIQC